MEDRQLPSELLQLERDLANRSLSAASAGLRHKILDDVRRRLRAERSRNRWQFAAAVAAAALLWANLSMSATQATDFGLRPTGRSESVETFAWQSRQLAPESSAEEARPQAVLLRVGANLPFMPRWVGSRVRTN
jgi:hypothetical protein